MLAGDAKMRAGDKKKKNTMSDVVTQERPCSSGCLNRNWMVGGGRLSLHVIVKLLWER